MSNARNSAVPIWSATVRLHNRRICAGLMADGSIVYRFRSLTDRRTIHGEVIRLSPEAVAAMMVLADNLQRVQKSVDPAAEA